MAEDRATTHTTGGNGRLGAPFLGAGRATQDPVDEVTLQPPEQGAAGSAPRCPALQPRVPKDTSTSISSAMATTLRTLLGPTVGARQLFLQDMEQALDSSQQWLNHYLPLGERQAEAKAAEGLDLASAGALRHGHPVPLGSLSEDARSRALALLQQLWQERLDAHHLLTQLQHILDMVEAMQEGLEGPLHNSQEPWECRNAAQADPCPHSACPHGQARSAEGSGTPMMLQALAVGRMLAQWLQDTLVQAVWRAQSGMAKVHATVSQAGSLWELLGTVVARGRKVVAQAWETLVVFTLQHLSLPWLEDAGMAALRVTPPHPQN